MKRCPPQVGSGGKRGTHADKHRGALHVTVLWQPLISVERSKRSLARMYKGVRGEWRPPAHARGGAPRLHPIAQPTFEVQADRRQSRLGNA
jgi:hypothetical protein